VTLLEARYFADTGPIALAERIGKGGEGEVYAVEGDPARAVKLYGRQDAERREAKIAAMVEARLAATSAFVAFPAAVVRDERRRFAGFAMPRVAAAQPLHELYAPGARKRRFPDADYRFLVRAALNAARAVAATHAAGCVIGDVNHSGFLIGEDARVSLIDADSFQFERGGTVFPCTVGVPEYTPPELSGRPLSDTVRTANHDAFGLAVVLFQLLFMGRHPFAGVGPAQDDTVPEAIAAHRFAYARERDTGLSPPPGALTLDDVTPGVATLFERAFAPEGQERRPAAAEWVDALTAMEAALIPCVASLRHHFPDSAPGCPWCRMEGASGTPIFLLPGHVLSLAGQEAPSPPPFDAAAWRARLAARPAPETFAYDPPPPPMEEPVRLPQRSRWPQVPRLLGGLGMLALGAANVIIIPQNWLLSAPAVIAGAAWVRDFFRPGRAAHADLTSLDARLSRALLTRQQAVDIETPFLLQAQLDALVAARETLPERVAQEESRLQEARIERARQRYLSGARLSAATVPALDGAALAALHAAGIETARDVLMRDPAAAAGIGAQQAEALRGWARDHLARFRPDRDLGPQDRTALGQRQAALVREADAMDERLHAEMSRLEHLLDAVDAARTQTDADIEAMLRERAVLEREIANLGQTPPPRPVPAPKRVRADVRARAREIRNAQA
jgi:DNA-binding helix-hairpin-helix protein with protein kinase domain